jgi:hypothetical protein
MEYGSFIGLTIAMFVVFAIDVRQKRRAHSRHK